MGKRKGGWRKFFCCAGPPETQSSTCININESDHLKPPPEPELQPEFETDSEQEDEDLYIEAEVQTSKVEIPEGNRWRWSRLHNEVEVQTSNVALPTEEEEEEESASEIDAQIQTSFQSLPREVEAQVQTSFLSLGGPTPFETDAQVQTSLIQLPRESHTEAQVQTSLLSLPGEREAQVQTSFLSLPEKRSVISVQVQPSYPDILEKVASVPMLVETQVQTSDLEMPPSETDFQVQTSFSDYMSEKEEVSSIGTEQQSKRSSSQLSETDVCTLYPLYIDAEVQTLPVEVPPGNDWRSARLKADIQVQVSDISQGKLVPQPQEAIQMQPSKLTLHKPEKRAEELEAPLARKEKPPPSQLIETGIQTSRPEIQEDDKQSLSEQSAGQIHPSTAELLKKLSVLSQVETVASASRPELLKKISSLSVTDPHLQTSGHDLQRKRSSLSDSAAQDQVLNAELLEKQPSLAQVTKSSYYEPTSKFRLPSSTRELQVQTSDLELMKKLSSSTLAELQRRISDADLRKYSSVSLVEAPDGNQEEVTEGREYLITPQLIEAQIRKWYHESPEVQTASQAPVPRGPLLSPTVDIEVQTSSVEIPQGNRWRASRLQADAKMQTSELQPAVEEAVPCPLSWKDTQAQTSLLGLWQARGLADAQIQTSNLSLARTKVEPPPTLVIDSHMQTSMESRPPLGIDHQMQTSMESRPPLGIDHQMQTSMEIRPPLGIDYQMQTSMESRPPLGIDHQMQTSMEIRPPLGIDHQMQTSMEIRPPLGIDYQMQTSMESRPPLGIDHQMQTSMESHPPLGIDHQMQTSMESRPPLGIDHQMQTSMVSRPPLGIDHQMQTSVEIRPPLGIDHQLQTSLESRPPLGIDHQMQTSMEIRPPLGIDHQMQTSLESRPPLGIDHQMQTSLESRPPLGIDYQMQTSMEIRPPLGIDHQMQTSLESRPTLGIDHQMQTSMEIRPPLGIDHQMQTSVEIRHPLGIDHQMQTSLESRPPLGIDHQMQTSMEIHPPLGIDHQMQTSMEIRPPLGIDHQMQTSMESRPPLGIDYQMQTSMESHPPLGIDRQMQTSMEVQTSMPSMWRGKDKTDTRVQTSSSEVPGAQEELPLLSQADAVVQTTDVEIPEGNRWRSARLHADVQLQTSMLDLKEADLESPPPSQINTQVQTSLLDIWKTKDLRDAGAQPSQTDMSPSLEEPPLPSQPENVVQSSASETAESLSPSQIDTQVQTSLLDIWKTKNLRDTRTQTSWTEMSPPLQEPPLPQSLASETAEPSPPSQINTEAQTSLVDIWKTKEVRDSLAQTSQLNMSESAEKPLLPPQPENVVPSPTPETTESHIPSQADTEAQTSFFDIWKAKELTDDQIQTSWSDLPKHTEELCPLSQSPVPIATPESSSPDQLEPKKQTSLLEMWKARGSLESLEMPRSSPSPTGIKAQPSQLDTPTLEELRGLAQMPPSDLDSAILESTVPSRTASPVCLPTPANAEAALLVQTKPPSPASLLEVWTIRQEAEVQMQTANLGLSFDKDSPLFPILLESQEEEKKPAPISKVEGKAKLPILTEAQVQTSFVEIPKGKKWRSSRLCTEAQVQTSFPDIRSKDRMPALQKMVSDHVAAKRVQKGPKRATPVSVHLHVKMSPKRRPSNEKKVADT